MGAGRGVLGYSVGRGVHATHSPTDRVVCPVPSPHTPQVALSIPSAAREGRRMAFNVMESAGAHKHPPPQVMRQVEGVRAGCDMQLRFDVVVPEGVGAGTLLLVNCEQQRCMLVIPDGTSPGAPAVLSVPLLLPSAPLLSPSAPLPLPDCEPWRAPASTSLPSPLNLPAATLPSLCRLTIAV